MPLTSDYTNDKFDIDLDYGKKFEKHLEEVFKDGKRVEVKTERNIWKTTGNIAIEVQSRNEDSGLTTTQADYWIHLLADNDKIKGGFIFPVDELKKKVKTMFKEGKAQMKDGGDDYTSRLVLLPIKELF